MSKHLKKQIFSEDRFNNRSHFDPKNGDQLFYLKAETFENYSPIARANPHHFDIFSYNITEEKHTQYTNLKQYSMDSLQVSPSDETVYIQMFDDAHAETLRIF